MPLPAILFKVGLAVVGGFHGAIRAAERLDQRRSAALDALALERELNFRSFGAERDFGNADEFLSLSERDRLIHNIFITRWQGATLRLYDLKYTKMTPFDTTGTRSIIHIESGELSLPYFFLAPRYRISNRVTRVPIGERVDTKKFRLFGANALSAFGAPVLSLFDDLPGVYAEGRDHTLVVTRRKKRHAKDFDADLQLARELLGAFVDGSNFRYGD